jgi:hypothetical protein
MTEGQAAAMMVTARRGDVIAGLDIGDALLDEGD